MKKFLRSLKHTLGIVDVDDGISIFQRLNQAADDLFGALWGGVDGDEPERPFGLEF